MRKRYLFTVTQEPVAVIASVTFSRMPRRPPSYITTPSPLSTTSNTSLSSTESLILVEPPSPSNPNTEPRTTPSMSSAPPPVAGAAEINSGQQGIGEHGHLTLDAIDGKPKLAGGVEAVVGSAKGENPEVVAVAEDRERKDSEDEKKPWFKRIAQSLKTDKSGDDSDMDKERDDAVPALQADHHVVRTAQVVDNTGTPVPTELGPPTDTPQSTASVTTSGSVMDALSEHDLAPHVSNARYHQFFDKVPEEDQLIEGTSRHPYPSRSRFRSSCVFLAFARPLLPDYRCALQRDILVQGRLFVSEHHISFRANILGTLDSPTVLPAPR